MPIAPIVLAAALVSPAPDVREYCTNAGPVSLTVDGAAVTGKYRISVKTPPDEGTIAGTLKEGLLEGTWTEPHSRGRILLAFSADFTRVYAIYNSSARPAEWFGQWHGVTREHFATMKPDERKDLRCDWK